MDKELKKLICSDLHRLGIKKSPSVFGNGLPLQAKYLILWRKAAFYYKRGGFLRKWYGWRLDKMQERTQITLPREVQAGSGLYIGHLGRLIVHPDVKMGSNINLSTGVTIGQATRDIASGAWVHLHNMRSLYDERSGHLDVRTGAPKDTIYE